jgi:hypothetical protein
MLFNFVFWKTPIEYRVEYDRSEQIPFEYMFRSTEDFFQNVMLIEARLAEVDRIRVYRLIANQAIEFNESRFYLDCSVYYAVNVRWTVRQPHHMTAEAHAAIEVWGAAIKPIILGTIAAHRTQLHKEMKHEIRQRARYEAMKMRDNAIAVLSYLDEICNED